MLDTQGRLGIGEELLSRIKIKSETTVQCFLDTTKKALVLIPETVDVDGENLYFIQTIKIHKGARIIMPDKIKKAFPEAHYLPSAFEGRIYIHIFEK